jgi:formamidopyrimidine-DNA glycosylase
MPELPDLVYIEKRLNEELPGKQIIEVTITEPVVLRNLIAQSFPDALVGARFEKVRRHGPFLVFAFDHKFEMMVHPMLAGRFQLTEGEKSGRGACFGLKLNDGRRFFYLDDKKMGKVYLTTAANYDAIPRFLDQGVDITSAEFTLERFQMEITRHRTQVRVLLMNQTALSAIGNAYADEILFDARIHPKTFCQKLTPAQISQLYMSIKTVIDWGITEVEKAQQPIEVKVRGHVKVRNRKDQPCPRCGTTIRRAGVLGFDSFFCPNCQPASRHQFIDWTH